MSTAPFTLCRVPDHFAVSHMSIGQLCPFGGPELGPPEALQALTIVDAVVASD